MATTPKVMVGMPTRGYPFVRAILFAVSASNRLGGGLTIQAGQPIHVIRNKIVRVFLGSDCTHLLTMDDDIVPPSDAPERLMALDAPVAVGVCPLVRNGRLEANVKGEGDRDWPWKCPETVFEAKHAGLGFVLIRRDVLEKVGFPWFNWPEQEDGTSVGEDVWFSHQVRRAGFRILCDGSILCGHVKSGVDLLDVSGWRDTPPR